MDEPTEYYAYEINQIEKDKYHIIPFIFGIRGENDINELISKPEIDSQT